MAGYGVVGRVQKKFWQKLQEGCGWAPRAFELAQGEEDGVRAGEEAFAREFVVQDDVDGVEVTGIRAVTGEGAGGERALQRGETENGVGIMAESELDEAVAESADAVVEEDGMGHGT